MDAGKVRRIGVANYTIAHLQELLPQCRIRPVVNQVELHPYLPQEALVRFCEQEGIHVTAYSSLGSGGSPSMLEDATVRASSVTGLAPWWWLTAKPRGGGEWDVETTGAGGGKRCGTDARPGAPAVGDPAWPLGYPKEHPPVRPTGRWAEERRQWPRGLSATTFKIRVHTRCRQRIAENVQVDFVLPEAAMAKLNAITTRMRFVDPRKIFSIDVFGDDLAPPS